MVLIMRWLLVTLTFAALLLQVKLNQQVTETHDFCEFILNQFQACAEDAYKAHGSEEGPY